MNGQFHVPATGWLHALDIRVKLCMTLVVVVLCSVWGNWMFLAAMLVVMHVMLLTDHVPARHVGRLWAVLGPLCALVAVIMLLSMNAYGTGVLWQLGWWRVTSQTLMMCLVVVLRVADIVLALFLTLFTTSHADWVRGLTGLHLPLSAARRMARAVNVVPQWFAVFRERRLMRASRGAGGGFAAFGDTWAALRLRERRASVAALTRGAQMHTGSAKLTVMRPAHMRLADWLVLLIVVLVAAGVAAMVALGW